ncbi:MAG: phage holin family protein [Bacilli bacterium]|nr:phage holin family protein [Bacilli bacterium]
MEEIIKDLQFTHDYWAILLPCVLMIFDIVTGYYNAWKKNEISSSKMRDGLGKKLAELVYIVISMLIASAFGVKAIFYFISIYVIYMEFVSVVENCEKLGMKMPDNIKEKINNNKGSDE